MGAKFFRTDGSYGFGNNCRYRPNGVLGKGVGNNENASENASKMRQNGSCFFGGKEERSKISQK